MSQIHKLDSHLINQIAAGEVVERPVSVVKELVENSLDAGATRIKVSLYFEDMFSLEVRDNGKGIERADFSLLFEKHATSKIVSLQDLQYVLSFGFRGEALAAIGSVSHTNVTSGTSNSTEVYTTDSVSREIRVNSGELGTKIRVENLFYNTPARLHYLKKEKTEYGHIYDYIQKIALIYPEISFELEYQWKSVLYFGQEESQELRSYKVFSPDFSAKALPLTYSAGGLTIKWYISHPTLSFGNKSKQILSVNRRLIQSPIIYKAISDAYNRYIAPRTFPWYVLNIEIDPTQVDVNVHPRKQELRFADESAIFRLVYQSVSHILESVSLLWDTLLQTHGEVLGETHSPPHLWQTSTNSKFYTGSGSKFQNYSPYTSRISHPNQRDISQALDFSKEILPHRQNTSPENYLDLRDIPLGRIIGQVHRSYILVETPLGMKLYDQHALAERVLFEKLKKQLKHPQTQKLLLPEMISLRSSEIALLQEYKQNFFDLGFDFEFLSHNLISLSGVPEVIQKQTLEHIFTGLLSDFVQSQGKSKKTLEEVQNRIIAYTACRAAVKFGDTLSVFEMRALLLDAVEDYSSTCPHGRPVIWEVSLAELKKKYER
jgi:DNA mismatch repair protein MutL